MLMLQPPQEHLLPLLLRRREKPNHRVRYAIEDPPHSLQNFLVRHERVPAASIVEGQTLALGFCDLFPHPNKRSLVVLVIFTRINHQPISSGVLLQ
jgi:hypothetical protein